ncbi:MAG: hypothetical protein NC293_13280 [Roseburia sp.]|nr:hypothetical protein [Roseburia sp.]
MFKKSLLAVIICIGMLLTACSETATEADNNAAGVSGNAVSAKTTFSSVVVRPEELPDKWVARGYRMDVAFMIKERTTEGYHATVKLSNCRGGGRPNWKMCLELEDEITAMTGAQIVSHEGNIYHIRATDKNKWISRYGMETFQVEVSCQGEIHHLGKVYLAKAKYRGKGISSGNSQKQLNMVESDLPKSFGARWRTYQDLYGEGESTYYDPDYDPEDFDTKVEKYAFYERRKWGKKMGR